MACRLDHSGVTFSLKRGRSARPLHRFFVGNETSSCKTILPMSDSNPVLAWVRTAMRCSYCKRPAGLLRRICVKCARVVAIVDRAAGRVGWTELVDLFAAEGLKREDVDTVLDAEVAGAPT